LLSLRVVRMAAGSALQDEGRPGWRQFGVPPGGAFDRESYALALALVGRRVGAVLELPNPGGEFEAPIHDRIAVVGASCGIRHNGRLVAVQSSFSVAPGDRVWIEPATTGVRTYIASLAGWAGDAVLGSVSNIPPKRSGTAAEVPDLPNRTIRLAEPPSSLDDRPIRFLFGPQARPSDRVSLEAAVFKVGLSSNRIGLRLEGGKFEPTPEFPSEPSVLGAVQLAPSGELLVHGPDGPTLAGYPKIAVVIDADLDRLAQLRAQDEVRFKCVAMDAARGLGSDRRKRLDRTLESIRLSVRA
jgi:5-oxoprolinase (ATP-hydrolysing) subunit C